MFGMNDVIENVRTGQRRIVTRITPAGAMGTSHASGPTFHAALIADDGTAHVGGHVLDIWSGSMSNPTADWRAVPPHVDYPHDPGRLYDCPACESRCHCTPAVARGEETECIFEGEHGGAA